MGLKAQSSTPLVELIEDKKAKRWNMYAQNNTDEEQEAFLMVQGKGFRRSATRPIIKKIPPNAKVLMATLIPLAGVTPTYEVIFTYESQLQTIEKKKVDTRKKRDPFRPLNHNELTIFIEPDCEKCTYLINYLNKNHIKYRKVNVLKSGKMFDFMWKNLDGRIPNSDVVKLPVVMENNEVYHDILNIKHFTQTYLWNKPNKG